MTIALIAIGLVVFAFAEYCGQSALERFVAARHSGD